MDADQNGKETGHPFGKGRGEEQLEGNLVLVPGQRFGLEETQRQPGKEALRPRRSDLGSLHPRGFLGGKCHRKIPHGAFSDAAMSSAGGNASVTPLCQVSLEVLITHRPCSGLGSSLPIE